ncbi:hypothetical protein CONCODRAFT_77304 [Conidiobolus coronatus NRRL 28638]|uniref:Uncharacterized protein n=1 Tax=Conidiobolus coronatus (strain ATCC 28846 / CBS 209.66 / NRRL 28638) TaxID=796925 RepID=A0A137PEZ6_CONC2|nr:hypothetical protein CONCODRAFT_77304 [Conidiobolus coronatus NRRL 28638]|eukprot:KXN73560.1 hypothetical protein CONCODRAFT_77304 [Conidiobolus coronatus NRRL 28638]
MSYYHQAISNSPKQNKHIQTAKTRTNLHQNNRHKKAQSDTETYYPNTNKSTFMTYNNQPTFGSKPFSKFTPPMPPSLNAPHTPSPLRLSGSPPNRPYKSPAYAGPQFNQSPNPQVLPNPSSFFSLSSSSSDDSDMLREKSSQLLSLLSTPNGKSSSMTYQSQSSTTFFDPTCAQDALTADTNKTNTRWSFPASSPVVNQRNARVSPI